MMRSSFLRLGVIAVALAATGCRSPRVDFYTLAPLAKVESAAPAAQGMPSVVVGPVTLPELVDRPQMVVRGAGNRVEILEMQRWAEPLKSEIPRVLAQQLGQQLGSSRVTSYREYSGTLAEYRVLVDILRFDAVPGDAVTVEADWTIKRSNVANARTGRSLIRQKIEGGGYDALVAAYGRALAGVSADLAAAIRSDSTPTTIFKK